MQVKITKTSMPLTIPAAEDNEFKEAKYTIQMPQWFIDPNKIDCELVIKNKKEGFGGFYKKCTDKQGYMRVVFVHHATGAENAVKFLKCESCSSIIGDNGGHLQRHQKKHSTSGNSTSRIVLNASKLDVSRLLSRFFATTGRPLHEMENSSFRTLQANGSNISTNVAYSQQKFYATVYLGKLDNEIAKLRTLVIIDSWPFVKGNFQVLPIAKSGYLSFMADFGRVHEDFLCLKASYLEERIDEDGSLKWVTLVVPIAYMSVSGDVKDANNIFIMIKQAVLNFFGEDLDLKTAFLTADGAHNIRRCATDHFNQYVRCFAHATDIIGKRTLLPYKSTIVSPLERSILKNYSDLLELCRLFTMSLKKDRALYKEIGVSLLDVVPTRWFSGFKCLVAVYKNIDKLGSFIAEMTPTSASHLDELLKIENRIRYKELSDVMGPLLQSNTYFQENSDSLKDVAVFVVSLMDEFDRFSVAGEKEVLVKFAKQATRKMCTDLDTIHFVATYLNPPSKDLHELQLRYDRHQENSDSLKDVAVFVVSLMDEFDRFSVAGEKEVLVKFAKQATRKMCTDLDTIHFVATYLNPPSKDLHELQLRYDRHQIPIDIVNDAQKLLDDLGKSFEEMRYQAPPQSQPPARHLTFLQRTLGGSSAPKSSSLHQEQQQYERDTRSMPASKFWPLAKSSYPILHEIARKVHAIQASEADVERSFSIIKNLYTPNRQSLDLKMLEKLMIFKEKDRFDTGET
ncbi:Protein CBG28126 [Caenorhabditis briggsae]|uniref:Protein CBG28126 n=1 Tax=Caenorhabditis briggsae TaxID=6238 RepID=B6IHW6_CAEBR|nr:Protein CBG28126 [Caenorhabditis briggsae]CAR99496.1 Protein CBG28126 [Caenorhabditis briggsae]